MSRPFYETPLDREVEHRIARAFATARGHTPVQLPRAYPVDYALVNGGKSVITFFEVKRRRHIRGFYPTLALGLRKYYDMLQLNQWSALPVELVIGWNDGVIGAMQVPQQHDIRMGGRTDRPDPEDTEPMAHFAVRLFEEVTR